MVLSAKADLVSSVLIPQFLHTLFMYFISPYLFYPTFSWYGELDVPSPKFDIEMLDFRKTAGRTEL